MRCVALFDVGGTTTRVTVTRNDRTFERPIIYTTPTRYAEGIRQLGYAIRVATKGWKVSKVVGCIAAPLDAKHERTAHKSNLPDWYGFPLTTDLRRRFHAPVSLENDAALAALGEARYGAGKGKDIVAYLTISTGVGGARIVDGDIDRSAMGFEPGDMVVEQRHGYDVHLESLISGHALKRKHKKPARTIGDRRVWREVEHTLALALTNVTILWSPEIIVLGGGIGRSEKLHLKNIRSIVRRTLTVFHQPPNIVRGKLGDAAGLWGALALSQKP